MRSFNKYIFIGLVALASCIPGEDPIQPFPRGDVKEVKLDMGASKTDIIFYSLSDASIIATADPMDWDVYFDGEHFRINYLRGLMVADLDSDFDSFEDTTDLKFFNLENIERMWTLDSGVYAIELGLDPHTQHSLGVMKVEVIGDKLRYKMLYTVDAPEMNFTAPHEGYFRLSDQEEADLPLDSEYDLVFGKYLHWFEVEMLNYEVFGVLQGGISAAESTLPFESIDQAVADTIQMTFKKDVVGYDWKSYNLDKGAYDIVDNKHYILRDAQGFYYKFRLTSYYNDKGVSGHPTFEFKLL